LTLRGPADHRADGAGRAGNDNGLTGGELSHAQQAAQPGRPAAQEDYKDMIVNSTSADIVYTNLFTGVHGN
jgi:nitronate monooxygenase